MITQSPSIDEIDRYAEQQGHDFGGSSYSVEDRNETGSPFHNARDSAATPHSSEYFNEEIEPEYEESNYEQGTLTLFDMSHTFESHTFRHTFKISFFGHTFRLHVFGYIFLTLLRFRYRVREL